MGRIVSEGARLARVSRPGLALVLLTAVVSGVSTFVNFFAVQGTNSDAFITARNALVGLLLVPFALLLGGGELRRLGGRDLVRLALIGLVGGAVPFILFFRGLQMAAAEGGAASATLGYRALFLFAALFGVVALKERLSARWAAGAGLLLAGNFLLLAVTGPVWTGGTAMVLAATVLWAAEYTLSKRALKDLAPSTVALGRMGFGAVFLMAYLAGTSGLGTAAAFSQSQWLWMLVSALLLVAFVSTWYAGLARVDLSVGASVLVLGFPITWALVAFAGRSTLGLPQAIGAAAVVFGVALAVGAFSVRGTFAAAAGAVRRTALRR